MSISFPYALKEIEEGTIPSPIATLPVKTVFGRQNFDFLVDSGADTTTLPLIWASLFGFKKENSKRTWIGGVEGRKIAGYPSRIEIGFNKKFIKIRCLFVESNIIPLLGRLDVWNNFSILFDNKIKETVFHPLPC